MLINALCHFNMYHLYDNILIHKTFFILLFQSVNCYLIDNHGYVMSKLIDPEVAVGKFFGDVENAVMKALLDDGIFTG